MKNYSNQKEEIATIKKRNISISLSDADCERLMIKTGLVGLTVDELLRNFIGDLVDGTYSNGSDERMYANNWYARCGFSIAPEETLMNFLLTNSSYGSVDDVDFLITVVDEIKFLRESVAYAEEFPEDCEDDVQTLQEELEDYLTDYHDIIDEYLEEHPDADIEKEIDFCRKWLAEYEEIAQTE